MALKGLAIRDITAPGFQPPPAGVHTNPEGGIISHDKTGDGNEASSGTTTTGGDAVAGNGEANAAGVIAVEDKKVKEICFNCWSQGSGQACTLHKAAAAAAAAGGSKTGDARPAESALMCKNWDVGVLRRRYRSEELQVKEGSWPRSGEEGRWHVNECRAAQHVGSTYFYCAC